MEKGAKRKWPLLARCRYQTRLRTEAEKGPTRRVFAVPDVEVLLGWELEEFRKAGYSDAVLDVVGMY